ncbi:alpha/beta hydrolase [Agromyces protaetiae]|uniref:alpha/beta hydrolase n=1 Tax=Agromyces protaetiae TaxID=2509455 RepID=UPI001FB57E00|nr:alpha/beta hydrolase [Agromyces protaetiae]
MAEGDWRPDVLGSRFEQLTLPLGEDDEGEVVATLVRYLPGRLPGKRWWWRKPFTRGAAEGADVLYLHGWNDYFFNPEVAEYWAGQGARFFALDLRKYGRSLRPGQTHGYITDLTDYDADLAAALDAMGRPHDGTGTGIDAAAVGANPGASARPLILVGHSTGGLVLSLWSARHPGRAAALVLNSPWLEFQTGRVGRGALTPVMAWGARVNPMGPLPNPDLGFYARSIDKAQGGEWEYDHEWRLDKGAPTHPAWLTAILAGHAIVAAGIEVGCPVLTQLSARSLIQPRWDEAMRTSDIVLVVDEIAERALRLGAQVTVVRIDGALHDVALSREPARAAGYAAITRWLRGYGPR